MKKYILAIDQGTTSTRAIVFDREGHIHGQHQIEFTQYFPDEAWVEHDAEEIWQSVLLTCKGAIENAKIAIEEILALGISNQRETTIVWDKITGKVLHNAIVWQDRRTAEYCKRLSKNNLHDMIREKTGLVIDPYFSATKIVWLFENNPEVCNKAQKNELCFGTIDSFLIWRLTNGKKHVTDITNASRTLLLNLTTQSWDDDLLKLFNIPKNILPEIYDNTADFGVVDKKYFGIEIPIAGVAGDQQAATIGQACFKKGMIKSTYGTGCFVLMNTGDKIIHSKNNLISTIAYRIHNKVCYGLEGSNFIAGAAIQWLRDELKFIQNAKEVENIAASLSDNAGVYLVPAFTGLGAPYWDPLARGAILGLTRDVGIAHIVRAALEAVCYQTKDLINAMMQDSQITIEKLRVDGGMVANNWMMQFLADILGITVQRTHIQETSALGVAYLAGLQMGLYASLEEITSLWQCDREFNVNMSEDLREKYYRGWLDAVQRVLL